MSEFGLFAGGILAVSVAGALMVPTAVAGAEALPLAPTVPPVLSQPIDSTVDSTASGSSTGGSSTSGSSFGGSSFTGPTVSGSSAGGSLDARTQDSTGTRSAENAIAGFIGRVLHSAFTGS